MKWEQYKNTNEEDQKINRYEAEADTQSIISYDDDIIKTLDQSRLERKLRKDLKILKVKTFISRNQCALLLCKLKVLREIL